MLADGVIPKTAALAEREHGDARKAVDTLYEVGRLAETEGGSTVTEGHVDDALRQTKINRFQKLVSGQPPHVKYILRAPGLLTESNEGIEFRTAEVYEGYKRVADHADADPLSYDRVQRLLNEQAFLAITASKHTGAPVKGVTGSTG